MLLNILIERGNSHQLLLRKYWFNMLKYMFNSYNYEVTAVYLILSPLEYAIMVHVRLFYWYKTVATSSLACVAKFLMELQMYWVKVGARAKKGKKREGRRGFHRFFAETRIRNTLTFSWGSFERRVLTGSEVPFPFFTCLDNSIWICIAPCLYSL